MTIETMDTKKQKLDNTPQRDTCRMRTTGFIMLDMLGVIGDFALDLMFPWELVFILIFLNRDALSFGHLQMIMLPNISFLFLKLYQRFTLISLKKLRVL